MVAGRSATMAREYSEYQRKVIERYYERRDEIMLAKLQELAGAIVLAESDRAKDRLWRRVEQAMQKLGVRPAIMQHILSRRDPAVLAANVEDWLRQEP
jgi:hypothetical protein